jgi:tRNA G18 (ribose-2'-O)-methylase SpoU
MLVSCRLIFLHDPKQNFSKRNILARAAQGIHFTAWEFVDHGVDLLPLLPANRYVVGVETAKEAENLYTTTCLEECHQTDRTVCFLFGSESCGVRSHLLQLCDRLLFIPSPGTMKSLNVSQAIAVVLFEQVRQRMRPRPG